MEAVFEKQMEIRSFEADWSSRIRASVVLNYLQEAAVGHARLRGISVQDMRRQQLFWVVSRFHLCMDRYARSGETVTMRTWSSTRQEIFTCREFEMLDGVDEVMARATSSWALLSMETRRPVPLDGNLPQFAIDERRVVVDDFVSLPELEDGDYVRSFDVLRRDLDMNGHVNNAVYAEWALETVPQQVAGQSRIAELEIGFRAEALYGETIDSRCKIEGNGGDTFIHRVCSGTDGRELARLRTSWGTFDSATGRRA